MRTILVMVILASLTATAAHAGEVTLLGWTTDGKFVVKQTDPEHQTTYGNNQDAFHARCEVEQLDKTEPSGKPKCVVCASASGDPAKECGLATKAKLVSSLTSPDKKLALKKKASCITGHTNRDCGVDITFPGFGVLGRMDDPGVTDEKKPQANVWWRPDSTAVMVHIWNVKSGKRDDTFWVIDTADMRQRFEAPKTIPTLVAEQLANPTSLTRYAKTAVLFTDEAARGGIAPAALAEAVKLTAPTKPSAVEVGVGTDGRSAWATFTTTTASADWRVTELFVRDGAEWRIASAMWSRGIPDKDADAKAQAGQLPRPAAVTSGTKDEVHEDLAGYVEVMRGSKSQWKSMTLGAKQQKVVVLGTAPKEKLAGAKVLDAGWRAWVGGGLAVGPIRGALVDRVAWLVTNVEVTRKKAGKQYTFPARVWLVVDDTGQNENLRGVVVAHFAVPQ